MPTGKGYPDKPKKVEMKHGGKTKKYRGGGMVCRGMGAATKGGKFTKNG